jgi:amino acid adenylation domain-containing protein
VFGAGGTGRNASVNGNSLTIVPVRIPVTESQTVHDFLAAIQQQAIEMISYEHIGLQQIASLSADARYACDFQTLLVMQLADDNELDGNETLTHLDTPYTLTLQCILARKGLRVVASFNPRIAEPWLVEKMLGQFGYAMQQLAAACKDTVVGSIDMLTPADYKELWEWNREVPTAVERCIHEVFAEQACARPEAPAICAWDGELTYGELDSLSTRLAHRLVELGVVPEMVVPLYFEKSMWTTVAMLGVLKAGGAFLLLDPLLPTARLKMLCRKVHATIGVASRSCHTAFQDLQVVSTSVILDSESVAQLPPSTGPPNVAVHPNHTAYVVFTSGSTGEPKGCTMEHRSSSSAVVTHGPALGINQKTRALQFAAYSFAGALAETLLSLVSGGCVCIPSEQERREGLAQAIVKLAANWSFMTSTILETINVGSVPTLRTICVGGEPIRLSQINQWATHLHLRQTYGSTETSGIVSSAKLDANSTTRDVGKAATGRYWIVSLADYNKLAPIGATGEILVEGPIIGREYIDERRSTAAAFIQPPSWRARFGEASDIMRFYKTGDLGQYQADGTLQLLGRKDTQVKLRGQRIELGEIEHQARLARGPAKEIVVELVKPRDSGGGEMPMLACFLVVDEMDGDGSSTIVQAAAQAIRTRLETNLPQYMIPSVFVPLRELPVTSSRKTDRRQLRLMGAQWTAQELAALRTVGQGKREAPRSEAERRLQRLWAEVLDLPVDSIGRDDSFFQLGGDSMVAMRLVGAVRRAGAGFMVADVFHNSKLCDLAFVLAVFDSITPVDELPAVWPFACLYPDQKDSLLRQLDSVRSESVSDILPLTSFQNDWVSTITAHNPSHSVHYSWLELGQQILLTDVTRTCKALLDQYPIMRSTFMCLQEQWWQIVLRPDDFEMPFRTVELRGDFEAEFKALCEGDTELLKPNQCPTGFILARHDSGRSRIVIRLSHAQYDGTSIAILWQTFANFYHRVTIPTSLAFSTYLAYGQSIRQSSISYWRTLLQGSQLTAAFPDHASTSTVRVRMSSAAPRLSGNITMASLLSAAWAMLLSHLTGKTDIVFGHVVAGRNAKLVGVETLCAPCINLIPVRVQLPAGQRLSQLLRSTHEQFINLGEADSLGWKDIFKNCTEWPAESRYNSVIQHQNLEERPEINLRGSRDRLGWVENPHGFIKPPSLHMITYNSGDFLTFQLTSNIASMTEKRMQALLQQLFPMIKLIADDYRTQYEDVNGSFRLAPKPYILGH